MAKDEIELLCCLFIFLKVIMKCWIYKPKNHGIKCKKVYVLVISPGGGAGPASDGDGVLPKVRLKLHQLHLS